MHIILYFSFNSYTSIDRDENENDDKLLLIIIEKKVE
jgi:hypothetical protein